MYFVENYIFFIKKWFSHRKSNSRCNLKFRNKCTFLLWPLHYWIDKCDEWKNSQSIVKSTRNCNGDHVDKLLWERLPILYKVEFFFLMYNSRNNEFVLRDPPPCIRLGSSSIERSLDGLNNQRIRWTRLAGIWYENISFGPHLHIARQSCMHGDPSGMTWSQIPVVWGENRIFLVYFIAIAGLRLSPPFFPPILFSFFMMGYIR